MDSWSENNEDEIVFLTTKIKNIVDTSLEENYFSAKELEHIQEQMAILIKQSVFWMKHENQSRFIYDLNNFLRRLVTYVEEKENERNNF